jgi:hypothetical protein
MEHPIIVTRISALNTDFAFGAGCGIAAMGLSGRARIDHVLIT